MIIYDLLKDTATALSGDHTLQTWSETIFGQAAEIFVDEDIRNPSDVAPAVRLHSPYKKAHQELRNVDHGFFVYMLINSAVDAINPQVNLHEFSATEQLMTFVDVVIGVINENKPNTAVMEFELETDTITNFPYFEADIAINMTQQLTIGQNPLTV